MGVLIAILSLMTLPFIVIMGLIIVLASTGKSLGIRKLYVGLLLKIFEWGREKIAEDKNLQNQMTSDIDESDDEEGKESEEGKRPSTNRTRFPSVGENYTGGDFDLTDPLFFAKNGIEAILKDEVTTGFDAAELSSWNMLTRTNNNYQFLSTRLTILWSLGFFVRYVLLLPFRVVMFLLGALWVFGSMSIAGRIESEKWRRIVYERSALMASRILARTFSAIITFHNQENAPKAGGVCVANHTSPIDAVILMCDRNYALVGQKHGGMLGMFQNALIKGAQHIWFERGEMRDRTAVTRKLTNHVQDPTTMPILIFPEGTCVNNTRVFMFKKGSFELDCTIYPVAIKYNPIFGDPFWNSGKHSMMQHMILMMTSWAIVCDVWYLPPTNRREGESAVDFANRVKADIARCGGLVDLEWDGGLKRSLPKPQMKVSKQREFSNVIRRRQEMIKQSSNPDLKSEEESNSTTNGATRNP